MKTLLIEKVYIANQVGQVLLGGPLGLYSGQLNEVVYCRHNALVFKLYLQGSIHDSIIVHRNRRGNSYKN